MATPDESVTVRVLPCRLAEPTFPRDTVTVLVLSLVMTLPYWSSSLTTGWVAKAWPAVAVDEGCCVTTSCDAAAGLMTMLEEVAGARLPLENLSVMVSAVLSPRFVKVAIPPTTVAVNVP